MDELVMAIRRRSQGFTRGTSSYRGVTQHKSGGEAGIPSLLGVSLFQLQPVGVRLLPLLYACCATAPGSWQQS